MRLLFLLSLFCLQSLNAEVKHSPTPTPSATHEDEEEEALRPPLPQDDGYWVAIKNTTKEKILLLRGTNKPNSKTSVIKLAAGETHREFYKKGSPVEYQRIVMVREVSAPSSESPISKKKDSYEFLSENLNDANFSKGITSELEVKIESKKLVSAKQGSLPQLGFVVSPVKKK